MAKDIEKGSSGTTTENFAQSRHYRRFDGSVDTITRRKRVKWGKVITSPKLIFGGMTGFFFLVMIFSFVFARFMDLPWYQTFWRSYPGVNYKGDSINLYYFDVFSYLKNLGNGTDWARYLFTDTGNAFNTLAPEHWSILNALIFSINIIIFVLNLIQFPVKFGCVLMMYCFGIFGFTPSFPLWGFCEWIITKWELPMIPYLYE